MNLEINVRVLLSNSEKFQGFEEKNLISCKTKRKKKTYYLHTIYYCILFFHFIRLTTIYDHNLIIFDMNVIAEKLG